MRLLVAYATTDGQTRKVARFAADRLTDAGHSVELLPLADAADIRLERFDGAVLAGSVHLGRYQPALGDFAHAHATPLNAMPTVLLSVSLSAAGHDADDWAGLDRIATEFRAATGWTPGKTLQVAGALKFTAYDVIRAWAMRRIAAKADPAGMCTPTRNTPTGPPSLPPSPTGPPPRRTEAERLRREILS